MQKSSAPNQESNKTIGFLVIGISIVTLILTPVINGDSLIIPKMVVLFSIGMFILPQVVYKLKTNFSNRFSLAITLTSLLFIFQMILVMIISRAPWEQEFYGRSGRSLGFATYFALTLLLLYAINSSNSNSVHTLNLGLAITCTITSLYSIAQYYGFDVFEWETKTNGIIGTLGNPNFQSSFAAMALLPTLVAFWESKKKYISIVLFSTLIFTLYISESTQGYIAGAASIILFLLIYFWYKNRKLFLIVLLLGLSSSIIAISGMLNRGPLSQYLYKISVQSRGEMWRTALTTTNSNPFFGVGLDSFGDWSLFYRSERVANGVAEYADNAHNFFLQFALTGGYILAFISLLFVIITLYSFYKIQKQLSKFEKNFSAIFSSWVCFQLQALISPANISMLAWNFLISGVVVGYAAKLSQPEKISDANSHHNSPFLRPFGYLSLMIGLVLVYPYFNADRIAFGTTKTGDALTAVKSAKMFPESSVRYQRIGLALYNSNLPELSLDVARSATIFNPNNLAGWFLILVNEKAPIEERRKAKNEVLKLDPFNKEALQYKL
jgi:O-antigen ligase